MRKHFLFSIYPGTSSQEKLKLKLLYEKFGKKWVKSFLALPVQDLLKYSNVFRQKKPELQIYVLSDIYSEA